MSEKIDIEQVDGIGALASLTTTDKSNLVNAINEVNTKHTDFGGVNLVDDSHFYNGNTNGWSNAYGTQVVENHIYKKTFTQLNSAARIERVFPNLKAGIYTLTIFAKTPKTIEWKGYVNASNVGNLIVVTPESPDEFTRHSVTFKVLTEGNVTIRGYVPNIPVGSVIEIDWFKLETGYVGSDWTPTLEEQKSDWNETDSTKFSFIKNKPEIPNVTGFVPYTGANQAVNLNTQKITHDGIVSNVNSITSPWFRETVPLTANNKVAYLIIDGFIANTNRQLYIEVESIAGNGEYKRLVKGFNVNFSSTNIIGSQKDSRYIEVTGSGNDNRYGIGEVEKHSDTALKIPLIWISSIALSINKISVKAYTGSVSNLTFSIEYDATSTLTTEDPYLYRNASEKWVKDNYDFRGYGLGGYVNAGIGSSPDTLGNNTGFYLSQNAPAEVGSSNVKIIQLGNSSSSSIIGQIAMSHGNNNRLAYRSNISVPFVEFYHTGNFNPAQYVLQTSLNTQLANYATKAGINTFTNTNTFLESPYIPAGTLDGHAVNLGQLNSIIDNFDFVTDEALNSYIKKGSHNINPEGEPFSIEANNGRLSLNEGGRFRFEEFGDQDCFFEFRHDEGPGLVVGHNHVDYEGTLAMGYLRFYGNGVYNTLGHNLNGFSRTKLPVTGTAVERVLAVGATMNGSTYYANENGLISLPNVTPPTIDTTVKVYMPGEVANNDTVSCNASKTIIYLHPMSTGPLNIAIDPELQDGAELIVIHTHVSDGPGLFNINGSFINHTGQLVSTYPASQGKTYRFIHVKDLERFALVDVGQM